MPHIPFNNLSIPQCNPYIYSDLRYNKNRYYNVLPCNETRVKLRKSPDYINANWVGRDIATQAPIEETIEDFWRMVWENNVPCIVMLTNFFESDRKKADLYWSPILDVKYGDIYVKLKEEKELRKGVLFRSFKLTGRNNNGEKQEKIVHHYQYTNWPDYGCPQDTSAIIYLTGILRKYNKPIVYHCSAGIGRTGTLLAIMEYIRQMKYRNHKPCIPSIIYDIRKARSGCVQTECQYEFIYKVIHDIKGA